MGRKLVLCLAPRLNPASNRFQQSGPSRNQFAHASVHQDRSSQAVGHNVQTIWADGVRFPKRTFTHQNIPEAGLRLAP